ASIDAAALLRLIDHPDPDVAAFASELLNTAGTFSSLPMPTWLQLLRTRNMTVVAAVCDAFRKHVNFNRATLEQAVDIALSPATPVATLGLEILQDRTARTADERAQVARLSFARCAAVG